MDPAELLLLNIVATLRSGFGSSLSKCVAVYPDTELAEVEGHFCTFGNTVQRPAKFSFMELFIMLEWEGVSI